MRANVSLSVFAVCACAFAPWLTIDARAQHYDREGKVIPGTERLKSLVPPPPKPRERLPERDVQAPAISKQTAWVKVTVPNQDEFEVKVAPQSISIGEDEIVRYAISVTPPVGDALVAYEGMRCGPAEWRQYATQKPDGTWARNLTSKWQKTFSAGPSGIRHALALESFCESDGRPVYSPEVAIDRIEHPVAESSVRVRK